MNQAAHNKLLAARRNIELVARKLESLSESLAHIGMVPLSKTLDLAAMDLRQAEKSLGEGTTEALMAHVHGTESASINMVRAAIAGAQQ